MSHPSSRFTLRRAVVLIGLIVGGYYLPRHFELRGLDQVSLTRRSTALIDSGEAVLSSVLPGTAAILAADRTAAAEGESAAEEQPAAEDQPANEDKPAAEKKPATGEKPAAEKKPAAENPVVTEAVSSRRWAAGVAPEAHENLRIATWALGGFGAQQARNPDVMAIFNSVIQRFDIVALQQVRTVERDLLPNLIRQLNRDGRAYDYLAGPVQHPSSGDQVGEQLVFLFDTQRVVTDRTQLYSVADPDNRLTYKPLVGWFRAAEVDPRHAWTFSLVNMRVELARARQEVYELPQVISAIGDDGRGEDDVVVVGLFQADHVYLAATLGERHHSVAIKNKMTDIFVRHQTSNIITDRRATTEAIGRSGVLDFLRYHNLSIAQAEHVSPYLPVYAEFSPWEGGH